MSSSKVSSFVKLPRVQLSVSLEVSVTMGISP
eukprot:CAMPEP_0203679588 /NCGR_PEP_ID=MMETSP0090-20130426/36297_1 /ASSEMBLY_ACC=CAM_ASM_001088 /TAXON_ID=426623 /ORGANISM="Chaetoceros affinis, Strain CCMP159" /LENGTH=31 /DNA_ID= /DNA_START= /DNA_END= /DNA_ORIENTATION=